MSGQSGGHRLRLSKLNEQLTCKLCGGYFIDATTIIECLHSFCRSCIVKYLESNKYCPICEVQVHKSKPLLNIRPDHTLQNIVYKLVPGCYQNEMRCRKEFFSKHPEAHDCVLNPEARGEPVESYIYSPDESLSLSLEYFIPNSKNENNTNVTPETIQRMLPKRYLRCPAAVTVFHLQKLIRAKYGLSEVHRVDVMYKEEPLCSNYTLMDVMYIYHWKRKVPLHLSYRIFESSPKRLKLSEDNVSYEKSLTNAGIDRAECNEIQPANREWKEVQLKISETGVMSVTDISSSDKKKSTEIDDLGNVREELGESIEIVNEIETTVNKQEPNYCRTKETRKVSDVENRDMRYRAVEEAFTVGGETSKNKKIDTKETFKSKSQHVKQELEDDKFSKPIQMIKTSENDKNEPSGKKQFSTNNNTINTCIEVENQKLGSRICNESMLPNVGSKIDALSTKLQFHPKIGQVNNTYSKKSLKEKRTPMHGSKRIYAKLPIEAKMEDAKNRVNVTNPTASIRMVTLSQSPSTTQMNSAASASTNANSHSTEKTQKTENNKELIGKITEPVITISQKNQSDIKRNIVSSSDSDVVTSNAPSTSTSISSLVASTFPYMVHDIVGNVGVSKNSARSNPCFQSKLGTEISIYTNTATTIPQTVSTTSQCDVQTSSMSVYITSTSQRGIDVSAGQTICSTTTTSSGKTSTSKPNYEMTGIYSIPPCPDAIPISFVRPNVRKDEIIAKGTNLNEICAKIGTSGSKINDICAKIGENSKEKSKAESRCRTEVPDLLKIAKKVSTSSSNDMDVKHIPNVPIYTPSNSASNTDNKNVYPKDILKNATTSTSQTMSTSQATQRMSSMKKHNQSIGYKTLRDPPKSWNPTLSKNNYVAAKNHAKEMQQNQTPTTTSESSNKTIASKPAKIFKMRNMPRYLGNPASGVKPLYGIGNETKEKNQQQSSSSGNKNSSLNMLKIDPKTLSPIVSTVNSMIISSPPPPYSPNARNYQNNPYQRDICRNTGSPISPRNSPVNILSTNPFIPSPTPNTNPRLIYSHFPSPFPDASRFPNPLIRSPIGIPPPSAFHSSLPPTINKLYQRSSYIPQTTVSYSSVSQQQPQKQQQLSQTVQRISSSLPKSPKASPTSAITTFNAEKSESQILLGDEHTTLKRNDSNAFNLSKTGISTGSTSNLTKILSTSNAILPDSKEINDESKRTTSSFEEGKVSPAKSESPSVILKIDEELSQCENKKDEEIKDTKNIKDQSFDEEQNDKSKNLLENRDKELPKVNGDPANKRILDNEMVDSCLNKKDEKIEKNNVKEALLRGNLTENAKGDLAEKQNDLPQAIIKSDESGKTSEQIIRKSEIQRSKAES